MITKVVTVHILAHPLPPYQLAGRLSHKLGRAGPPRPSGNVGADDEHREGAVTAGTVLHLDIPAGVVPAGIVEVVAVRLLQGQEGAVQDPTAAEHPLAGRAVEVATAARAVRNRHRGELLP